MLAKKSKKEELFHGKYKYSKNIFNKIFTLAMQTSYLLFKKVQ